MKKLVWALLLLFSVAGCSLSAFAGSPTMGVLDPTCNKNTNNFDFPITNVNPDGTIDLNQFSVGSNGGGTTIYCNETQTYWTSVEFVTNSNPFGFTSAQNWQLGDQIPTDGSIYCGVGSGSDQSFLYCSVAYSANSITLDFYGTDDGKNIDGVRQNHTMAVTLNRGFCVPSTENDCSDNLGDWRDRNGVALTSLTFSGTVNGTTPVPEPMTMLLVASGAAVMWKRRRR